MSSMPDYDRGYRDGLRAAVTWLAERANTMNDPQAKIVLDSAAFSLGVEAKQGRIPSKARHRPTAPTTEQGEG